ncbi:lipopolysaccharide biosynthesis protein [Curtobacterium sp. MCBD17_019]|uniref:lipopolysaccharide biosynthesis protein n=1 Tax=Curtobacterium sp. MCBD17_019 TaxID=2175669 RepID=UPI0011B7FF5C|nr:hypothetical protein [Curtobacterium sp. MCBD17_019]
MLGRAFGGFLSSTVLTTVAGAVVIPVLIHAVGASTWAGVAVAQATGAVGAILINLGWGVSGPAEVGTLDGEDQLEYYRLSVLVRLAVAVPVSIACFALAALQRDQESFSVGLIAVAAALAGLGGQWYFYGTSAPRSLLLLDTLPRTTLSVVGAVLTLPTHSVALFAVAQVLGAIVPVALTTRRLVGWQVWHRRSGVSDSGGVRAQFYGTATALFGSAYLTLPVVIIAYSAPGSVVAFALADRLARIARLVIAPMTQTLQGWVASARDRVSRRTRDRSSLVTAALWGLLVAIVYASLARPVGQILSGGAIDLRFGLVVFTAGTLLLTAVSQTTGTIGLVLSGRRSWLAASAIVGAIVSLPLLLLLPARYGASGGAMAIVIGEAAVLAVQFVGLATGGRSASGKTEGV